jgi:AraC-like DNA-binding protein
MTRERSGSWHRLHLLLAALGRVAESGECEALAQAGYDPAGRHASSPQLGRVLEYIHRHLGGELTQHDAAAVVGLSAPAFSQFFRRALGKTYVTYVNELRIRQACRALIEGDQGVAQVAYAAGFNNLSHFNAQFRRLKRTTPRAFREAARRGVNREDLDAPEDWLGAFR